MFDRVLKFFLDNTRVNYTLFLLIFAVGIYSYIKTPKEIFPAFELDMISINGSYTGASIDILDKMAVIEIEDNIKSIDGIDNVSSIVNHGRFSIILELKKGVNNYNISDKVKDAVNNIKGNFPSDMDDPIVQVIEFNKDLLEITISSNDI